MTGPRPGRVAALLGLLLTWACATSEFRPDRVWLKDIGGDYMRGRVAGEIAAILRDELLQRGLPESAIPPQPRAASCAEPGRPGR